MHKYKVSAYMIGHDHNLQHISENYLNHTVQYFVSGAANLNTISRKNKNKIPEDSLKYVWNHGGFVIYGGLALVKANEKEMQIQFIRSTKLGIFSIKKQGKVLYETIIKPRQISNK